MARMVDTRRNSSTVHVDDTDHNYIHVIRIGSMNDKWRQAAPVNDIEASSWIRIFRAFDTNHDGLIQCEDMQKAIRDNTYSFGFDHYEIQQMSLLLEMRNERPIDFSDFCFLMSKCKGYKMREILFNAALTVTPRSQRISTFSSLQRFKCSPPPLFFATISLIQLIIYIFYVIDSQEGVWLGGPIPTTSPLIIHPRHYAELWRFLTYSLVQIGIYHFLFNIIIQLFIGVPMELVYKWRAILVYVFGVLSGALLSWALDRNVFLCGAAGGTFSLLTSHLITLLLHFAEMELSLLRVLIFIIMAAIDFVLAVCQRVLTDRIDKISFYGHVGGIVAGVLFNFMILRVSRQSKFYKVAFWVSIVVLVFYLTICTSIIVAPNLFH